MSGLKNGLTSKSKNYEKKVNGIKIPLIFFILIFNFNQIRKLGQIALPKNPH